LIIEKNHKLGSLSLTLKMASSLSSNRTEGQYGPGTFTDVSFVPVPIDCKRLLKVLAFKTPRFTEDEKILDTVSFVGDDLPVIPGPIKSAALTSVLHAMVGIVAQEILELKGIETSRVTVNTNQSAMYCATPALVTIDGVDGPEVLKKYKPFLLINFVGLRD
jgi:hypothetical protein